MIHYYVTSAHVTTCYYHYQNKPLIAPKCMEVVFFLHNLKMIEERSYQSRLISFHGGFCHRWWMKSWSIMIGCILHAIAIAVQTCWDSFGGFLAETQVLLQLGKDLLQHSHWDFHPVTWIFLIWFESLFVSVNSSVHMWPWIMDLVMSREHHP